MRLYAPGTHPGSFPARRPPPERAMLHPRSLIDRPDRSRCSPWLRDDLQVVRHSAVADNGPARMCCLVTMRLDRNPLAKNPLHGPMAPCASALLGDELVSQPQLTAEIERSELDLGCCRLTRRSGVVMVKASSAHTACPKQT